MGLPWDAGISRVAASCSGTDSVVYQMYNKRFEGKTGEAALMEESMIHNM